MKPFYVIVTNAAGGRMWNHPAPIPHNFRMYIDQRNNEVIGAQSLMKAVDNAGDAFDWYIQKFITTEHGEFGNISWERK